MNRETFIRTTLKSIPSCFRQESEFDLEEFIRKIIEETYDEAYDKGYEDGITYSSSC
jgi:hypothetical protein